MNPSLLIAATLLLAGGAQAEEAAAHADKRAVQAAVQRDARANQSTAAAITLPVGRSAWVQAGVGRSRSRDEAAGVTFRPTQVSVGGGVAGQRWQASLNASQRRDGDRLRQVDWAASGDWQPVDGVNLGVDVVTRRARGRGAGTPPAEQRLRARGLGLHASVAVTQRLSLHGATMRSRYRSSTAEPVTGGSGGLLDGVLGRGRVSVVNREEAALDRSHQLGASYRVGERVTLHGELAQDRVYLGGRLRSVQLKAAIAAGRGWTLTPGLGRSHGPDGEGVGYGMLAASYAW